MVHEAVDHVRSNHVVAEDFTPTVERFVRGDGQGGAFVITLTRPIAELKKKQHRQQLTALRDALERAHGENLDLRRELARRGIQPSPNVVSIATTS